MMFDLIPYVTRSSNMENLFDQMTRSFFGGAESTFSAFKTDIVDKGDCFLLQAELPGFAKENINLDVNGDTLTISAVHNEEHEEKEENYLRRERRFGSFQRRFDVSGIKADEISASYQNGVLELTLPKKEAAPLPAKRQIEIQ